MGSGGSRAGAGGIQGPPRTPPPPSALMGRILRSTVACAPQKGSVPALQGGLTDLRFQPVGASCGPHGASALVTGTSSQSPRCWKAGVAAFGAREVLTSSGLSLGMGALLRLESWRGRP